ncbi:hypothetical protein HDV63DRAFT_367247 [Trichoderma sp. SZMC 28014]
MAFFTAVGANHRRLIGAVLDHMAFLLAKAASLRFSIRAFCSPMTFLAAAETFVVSVFSSSIGITFITTSVVFIGIAFVTTIVVVVIETSGIASGLV